MKISVTPNDLFVDLDKYLDRVNKQGQTLIVNRNRERPVAMVSSAKFDQLETYARTRMGTREHAIARDRLIRSGVLSNDPIVKSDDDYWDQF